MAKKETRKFYQTTLTVVVLHEGPFEYDDLADVSYQITEGECSGQITGDKTVRLGRKAFVTAVKKQGSDPDFFQLDDDGKDVDSSLDPPERDGDEHEGL